MVEARARGNYVGCVGAGNLYGQSLGGTPFGPGIFAVNQGVTTITNRRQSKLTDISDGTSNTIILSERQGPTLSGWAGNPGDITLGNMGAGLFCTLNPPNSTVSDLLIGNAPGDSGVCPQSHGDNNYKPLCNYAGSTATNVFASANSKHTNGVNVGLADGSVKFVSNSVDHYDIAAVSAPPRMGICSRTTD